MCIIFLLYVYLQSQACLVLTDARSGVIYVYELPCARSCTLLLYDGNDCF